MDVDINKLERGKRVLDDMSEAFRATFQKCIRRDREKGVAVAQSLRAHLPLLTFWDALRFSAGVLAEDIELRREEDGAVWMGDDRNLLRAKAERVVGDADADAVADTIVELVDHRGCDDIVRGVLDALAAAEKPTTTGEALLDTLSERLAAKWTADKPGKGAAK